MREACAAVIANFKSFIGSGWLMWLCFCVALIICFFVWKEKRKKLVTVSLLGCVVIINPIVYQIIGTRFMSGVYWRLFWALPIVIVVAAVLTMLVGKVKKEWLRIGTAFVLCMVILLTGKSVINRGTYTISENDHQIPQEAIEVSDLVLEANGGVETRVIVPDELVCYIRQYTSKITLAYGRNLWGFINNPTDWQIELHDMMTAEEIDLTALREKAREVGCGYIVFNSEQHSLPENMDQYGYILVGENDPYKVYALNE